MLLYKYMSGKGRVKKVSAAKKGGSKKFRTILRGVKKVLMPRLKDFPSPLPPLLLQYQGMHNTSNILTAQSRYS